MSQLQEMMKAYEEKSRSWIEITEERYDDLLEVVPPLRQSGNRFVMGEPVLIGVYFICRHVMGKYQYLLGTLTEWNDQIYLNNDPDNVGINQ